MNSIRQVLCFATLMYVAVTPGHLQNVKFVEGVNQAELQGVLPFCPRNFATKKEGEISGDYDDPNFVSSLTVNGISASDYCDNEANFKQVGDGIYRIVTDLDYALGRWCCQRQGLDLVPLETEGSTSAIEFIQGSSKFNGMWGLGSVDSECVSLAPDTVNTNVAQGSTSSGGCSKLFPVVCFGGYLRQIVNPKPKNGTGVDPEGSTFGVTSEDDEEGKLTAAEFCSQSSNRIVRISNFISVIRMVELPYRLAKPCCGSFNLSLVDTASKDAASWRDELGSYLRTVPDKDVWHVKSSVGECQQVKSERLDIKSVQCSCLGSVICIGELEEHRKERADERSCAKIKFKSISHGRAFVSSRKARLTHDAAAECCNQHGYENLLSLDHMLLSDELANSFRAELRQPYHIYSRQNAAGIFGFIQGDAIPRSVISRETYGLGADYSCLFAVIEVDEIGQRFTKFTTGACETKRPFICMNSNLEEKFNRTCKFTKYMQSLEGRGQTPSKLRQYHLKRENRFISKRTISLVLNGWTKENELTASTRSWKFVSQAYEMFRKIIPPEVLPNGFLSISKLLYIELNSHYGFDQNTEEIINTDQETRINRILEICTSELPTIPFLLGNCKNRILAIEINPGIPRFLCPSDELVSYNHFTTDPILHIAQNVFQTVRNLCFKTFSRYSRLMFHTWQVALHDTFAKTLESRLHFQIESPDYWNRILGPRFDEKVRVTDAVAESVLIWANRNAQRTKLKGVLPAILA